MELIRPMKQTVWKWPAVVNFSLGGLGTGFYLLGLLVGPPEGASFLQLALFKLLGPLLAGLGFVALTTEAGRPMRGYNLFRHLRRSWMSRETLAAAIFIPVAGLEWLLPHPALRALAGAAAVGLMISQGFIVYRARGVTAWNVPLMPLLFVTSGFATGAGLMLAIAPFLGGRFQQSAGGTIVLAGLVAVLFNLVVWILYLRGPNSAFQRAIEGLRRSNALALSVGLGHLLPALLLVSAVLSGGGANQLALLAGGVAGLTMIAGGVTQKAGIILGAGYLRAIVLGPPRPPAGSAVRQRP